MIKKSMLIAAFLIVVGFIGLLFTDFNIYNSNNKAFSHEWEYSQTDFDRLEVLGHSQNIDLVFKTSVDDKIYITMWGHSEPQIIDQMIQSSIINDTFIVNMGIPMKTRWISFGLDKNDMNIWIALPENMVLDDVKLQNKSGNIKASNMGATTAELKSEYGKITVSDSQVNQLNITAKAGNLEISNHAGNINSNSTLGRVVIDQYSGNSEVRNESGKVEIIQHSEGSMKVYTNNGSQRLIQHTSGDIEADTKLGSIHVTLGKQFSGSLTTLTTSGKVSLPDNLTSIIEENGHTVKLKTMLGKITVTQ